MSFHILAIVLATFAQNWAIFSIFWSLWLLFNEQQNIFAHSANLQLTKEYRLQIYLPLSYFDHLVIRPDYCLGSLLQLILGSTFLYPLIYQCIHQSAIVAQNFILNIFVCTTVFYSLKSQPFNLKFWTLDSSNG